jgi:hypothetical protein
MKPKGPNAELFSERMQLEAAARPLEVQEAAERLWLRVAQFARSNTTDQWAPEQEWQASGHLIIEDTGRELDSVRRLVLHDGLHRVVVMHLLLAALRDCAASRKSRVLAEIDKLVRNPEAPSSRALKLALGDAEQNTAFAAVMGAGSPEAVRDLEVDLFGFAKAYLSFAEGLRALVADLEASGVHNALEERLWPAVGLCGWTTIRCGDAAVCMGLWRVLQSRGPASSSPSYASS